MADRDTERHHNREEKTNWWPLLLIPIAFFIGWGANAATDNANDRASTGNSMQYGVGGGPGTQCPSSPSTTTP